MTSNYSTSVLSTFCDAKLGCKEGSLPLLVLKLPIIETNSSYIDLPK